MPKKQSELPGVESQSIPEIEEAAENYRSVRDKRMALTEKEVAAKVNLIQVVQAHAKELTPNGDGKLCYRYDDQLVMLTDKINVKVKTDHGDNEDEDEE